MTSMRVTIEEIGGGKPRMSTESQFPTVGQIDAILAEDSAEAD